MSDFAVVCRVFDDWRPLGGGISDWILSDLAGVIDEYHRYVRRTICGLRRGATLDDLTAIIRHFAYDHMGVARNSESVAGCEYVAWSLHQVWRNHQSPTSNLRSVPHGWVEHKETLPTNWSMIEIIQCVLELWDPLHAKKSWSHGADTLGKYDGLAMDVLSLLRGGGSTSEIESLLLDLYVKRWLWTPQPIHKETVRPYANAFTRIYWNLGYGVTRIAAKELQVSIWEAGLSPGARNPRLSRIDLMFENLKLPR